MKSRSRSMWAVRKRGTKHKWLVNGSDCWEPWGSPYLLFAEYHQRIAEERAARFGGVVVEIPEPK